MPEQEIPLWKKVLERERQREREEQERKEAPVVAAPKPSETKKPRPHLGTEDWRLGKSPTMSKTLHTVGGHMQDELANLESGLKQSAGQSLIGTLINVMTKGGLDETLKKPDVIENYLRREGEANRQKGFPPGLEEKVWGMGGRLLPAIPGMSTRLGMMAYPYATTLGETRKPLEAIKSGALGAVAGAAAPLAAGQKIVKGVNAPAWYKPVTSAAPERPQAIDKLIVEIKAAKLSRKEMTKLQREALAKKFGEAKFTREQIASGQLSGEAGFYQELGKFKDELPKTTMGPVRQKFSQEEIDELFLYPVKLWKGGKLTSPESLHIREGLVKLLSAEATVPPQPAQLSLMSRVFGDDFVNAIMKNRTAWQKIKDVTIEGINVPRSLMASFDLSAPLRQGLLVAAYKPKLFFKSFLKMFGMAGSEKSYAAVMNEIRARPTYELMVKSKLPLTEIGRVLIKAEEPMMGAGMASKIPIVGKGVEISNRAYTGFLNKLRADVFDDLVKNAYRAGRDPMKDPQLSGEIARLVGNLTGRGSLGGGLERMAPTLNALFFSPRLMASRVAMLNPRYYIKADPFVGKEALKSMLATTAAGMTILGLAKLGGADVSSDMRSADFGKIRVGDTRFDIWGGFQPYIRTMAQLISGTTISTTTGREAKLGQGYKATTEWDVIERFFSNKTAPIFSLGMTLLKRGQDRGGEPLNITDEVARRFIPMFVQDVMDIQKTDPDLIPLSSLGAFGVGIQSYPSVSPQVAKAERQMTTGKEMTVTKFRQLMEQHRSAEAIGVAMAWNKEVIRMSQEYPGADIQELLKFQISTERIRDMIHDAYKPKPEKLTPVERVKKTWGEQ